MFAGDFAAPGSLRRGISPPAGGELLCPWRLVVAMAQATFSWPFGPIHLESACLRFRLTAKTATAPLLLLFPANPLRWASPGVRERLTKTPLGTAQDERSALIFAHPTPSGPSGHLPLTGGVGPGPPLRGLPLAVGRTFPARKTRSAWSKFPPPHWGLSLLNLEGFAVQDPRLVFRTNAPGPVFVVGATLTVARKAFPGGRLFKVHALYL